MTNSECLLILLYICLSFVSCNFSNNKETNNTLIISDEIFDTVIKPESVTKINLVEKKLQDMGLINIQDSISEILVDLRYAGTDNFLGINFYGELNNAFMQPACYYKLKSAYEILQNNKPGYTFLIYDAVRSIQAQQLMWDSLKVPANKKFWYVADPAKGSIHNYGMAVDLTLVDDNGLILDMGTEFDYFGELAFPNKTEYFYKTGELNEEQYLNRNLLINIMEKAGFTVSKTEWWHYNATSLQNAKEKYTIFDLD